MTAYDAGNPEHVKRRNEQAKLRSMRCDAGFRKLMEDKEGRAWMWETLAFCGLFTSSFSTCNAEMAFNEGRRNVGLLLMANINKVCPELYQRMVQEQKENDNG